jgi:hypothetical protein
MLYSDSVLRQGVGDGRQAMIKHIGTWTVLWAITTATWAHEPLTDNGLAVRQGFGITDITAMDAAAAWSFADFNSFQLHVDSIWNNYDLIKTKELPGQSSIYYGVGGRLKLKGSNDGKGNGSKDEDATLGVRIPVGVSYIYKGTPVELFAEVAPLLAVMPETKLGIGVGIGARYYFTLR